MGPRVSDDGPMGGRGWRPGRARARLAVTLVVAVAAPGLVACARDLDRAQSLHTTLGALVGVSDADVAAATADTAARLDIVLDRGLGAGAALQVIRDVTAVADEAGWTHYLLDVRRSLVDQDSLVVDEGFPRSGRARVVIESWIRVTDALLGEVTHSYQAGNETISVVSGGDIGHDVAEASRIGYGRSGTTWRFHAEGATYVVSGRVERRDTALFDRVQRTVSSPVLPVPATTWRLERRSSQVLLDLEVNLAGDDPERISVERQARSIRPLAVAALNSTRSGERARWLLISDRTATGEKDPFASWSSTSAPVQGRDRYLRGWDRWWRRLAERR